MQRSATRDPPGRHLCGAFTLIPAGRCPPDSIVFHPGYLACSFTTLADGQQVDEDGFLLVDDFGTSINLMLQCGMLDSGGRLVEGDFEGCLKAIRQDLDSGQLLLAPSETD